MPMVSVHQPNFMPWNKLLAKVLSSDVFIAYDTVQFTRREFHARQLIDDGNGKPEWLTVPVQGTGSRQRLCEVQVVRDRDWRSDHLGRLSAAYGRSPFFSEVFPLIQTAYDQGHSLLVDHNLAILEHVCAYLGSEVRIVRASELDHCGTREERLLDLVRGSGGDAHLTSTTATHVVDWSGFDRAGIPVYVQSFNHPSYPQGTEPFTPNLAAVDLLFNCGQASGALLASVSSADLLPANLEADPNQSPDLLQENTLTR